MFITDRLYLRPFRDSDMQDLLNMANNAELERFLAINYIVPNRPNGAESIYKFQSEALLYVVVTLKSTGEFMGYSMIWQPNGAKNRSGMFGIGLLPQYWGKGYGTEVTKFIVDYAFRWLGLHRIALGVFEGNERAIAIYKKV